MFENFPLFPESASTMAGDVDSLYFFLTAVSLFFVVIIFGGVFFFALRYQRRSESERPRPIVGSLRLELLWTIIPLILSMIMFAWGAKLYFDLSTPPEDSLNVYVVGKQWMWKIQHPEGKREINTLHVPTATPVRLIMTSEDVIHSFYIPAFRVKMDVLPGRYTSLWFEATKPGRYHLFCAEYCGTSHSDMVGSVVVMAPGEFQNWLGGQDTGGQSMAEAGGQLFSQMGCITCHSQESGARGPDLQGAFGNMVALETGEVLVDEDYIRESILNPNAKIVRNYRPVMPTYKGQISEEGILKLIAYIKSLSQEGEPADAVQPVERIPGQQ